MAITLDELLGKNVTNSSTQTVERFPSYDDFQNSRRTSQQDYNVQPAYNFDRRPQTALRSEASVRDYEANRPYEQPRMSEYTNRDYAMMERPQIMNSVAEPMAMPVSRYSQNPTYEQERNYGFDGYQNVARPEYRNAERMQNLYEFTNSDNDTLPESELFDKLSYKNAGHRPILEKEEKAKSKFFSFAKSEKAEAVKGEKKQARLNTKGKIIVSLYVAAIVAVSVLIIVNAGDLNSGKATAPTSAIEVQAEMPDYTSGI